MVTIDQNIPNRIIIGPDRKIDWVEVSCVGHFVEREGEDLYVKDYCDYSPIERIHFDPNRHRWLIKKKKSVWGFYNEGNPMDMRLELLEII